MDVVMIEQVFVKKAAARTLEHSHKEPVIGMSVSSAALVDRQRVV